MGRWEWGTREESSPWWIIYGESKKKKKIRKREGAPEGNFLDLVIWFMSRKQNADIGTYCPRKSKIQSGAEQLSNLYFTDLIVVNDCGGMIEL